MDSQKSLSILLLNQDWFQQELTQLGHRVVSAAWSADNADIKFERPGLSVTEVFNRLPAGFSPDVVLYHDNSGPVAFLDIEKIEIPTVFYSIDTHHHDTWHRCFAAMFDQVFVAQKAYCNTFEPYHLNAVWVPLWVNRDLVPQEEKSIDVCFRGNLDKRLHPERAQFFEELSRHVSIDAGVGKYWNDYIRSKVVVNQSVKDDLNFRVFESMASGAALVTPSNSSGLRDLFVEGEDLLLYESGNAEDAAAKVKMLLEDDNLRKKIAESGRRKVIEQHSGLARARDLANYLSKVKVTNRPKKLMGAAACMYTSSGTMRKISDVFADMLLDKSIEYFIKSAESQEGVDLTFVTYLHYCKYSCEMLGYPERAERLVREVSKLYPLDDGLKVSLIETLLDHDKNEEALELARTIAVEAEDLIKKVPAAFSGLRSEVYNQINVNAERR